MQSAGNPQGGEQPLKGVKVLLVEDNLVNQQVAFEILSRAGMIVHTAANGQTALDRLDEFTFDVVLMDIQMPVMDGFTATRIIRRDKRLREIPIIAVTAHAMPGDRKLCLDAGMNDYVAKPIDKQRLLTTIARWIEAPVDKKRTEEQPSDKRHSDVDLIEHPGNRPAIDVAEAVERFGGNEALFFRVLSHFVETYADLVSELRRELSEGDIEGACVRVHTVKGVAGSLSASALFETAHVVECALRAGKTSGVDEQISRLNNRFTDAMAFGLKLLSSHEQRTCKPGGSEGVLFPEQWPRNDVAAKTIISPAERSQLVRIINELSRYVQENDPVGAEHSLCSVMSLLSGRCRMPQLSLISRSIDNYDFEPARKAIEDLARAMDIPLTSS
ncbi:MAG: response regulator [Syntrophobacteraceae bacterium]